jgi:hypothetical protein
VRSRRLIAAGLVSVLASAGCGGSGSKPVNNAHHHARRSLAAVQTAESRIIAGSSSVALGASPEPLLIVPRFGTLWASCELRTGRLSTKFVLAAGTPSNASIVVSIDPGAIVRGTDTASSFVAPTGPAGPVAEMWQVTPFSSAVIEVATVWVTAQPAPAAFGHHGCVAGAQATVSVIPR